MSPRLEVEGLTIRHGEVTAVDGASLRIDGPGITALLGPSGCGKTSLLRGIAGFEVPVTGSVRIDGNEVAGPSGWVEPEARHVGMVFQQGALFPHLRVRDNVAFGLRGQADGDSRVVEVLELVGLAGLAERWPDQLSGGQQQLVALARALAPGPRLVLLDEPFASLDAALRTSLREEVRRVLERSAATAIIVSHDQEEALSIAGRVVVMSSGRILQDGTPEQVYREPSCAQVASFVGGGQLLPCDSRAGVLVTPLGSLPTDAPEGQGQLLVRPEQLELLPGEADGGVPGTVVARSYYGHDQLNEVRLDSGESVRVRILGEGCLPGARVRVVLLDRPCRLFQGSSTTLVHPSRFSSNSE